MINKPPQISTFNLPPTLVLVGAGADVVLDPWLATAALVLEALLTSPVLVAKPPLPVPKVVVAKNVVVLVPPLIVLVSGGWPSVRMPYCRSEPVRIPLVPVLIGPYSGHTVTPEARELVIVQLADVVPAMSQAHVYSLVWD